MGTGISPCRRSASYRRSTAKRRTRSRFARRVDGISIPNRKATARVAREFRQWRIYPHPSPGKRACRSSGGVCEPARASHDVSMGYLFQTEKPPQGWLFCLEQMTGIEPAFLAWEANALPLSYICIFNLRQLLYRKMFALSMPFLNFMEHLRKTKSDTEKAGSHKDIKLNSRENAD